MISFNPSPIFSSAMTFPSLSYKTSLSDTSISLSSKESSLSSSFSSSSPSSSSVSHPSELLSSMSSSFSSRIGTELARSPCGRACSAHFMRTSRRLTQHVRYKLCRMDSEPALCQSCSHPTSHHLECYSTLHLPTFDQQYFHHRCSPLQCRSHVELHDSPLQLSTIPDLQTPSLSIWLLHASPYIALPYIHDHPLNYWYIR